MLAGYVKKELFIREIVLLIVLTGVVIVTTLLVIRGIKLREDLSFLQIDFTDTIIEAKRCLDKGGTVQNVSQSQESEKIFVCSRQDLSSATYPDLSKLSRRGIKYKYLSPEKCLTKKCDKKKTRINIGRGLRLVLSCDIEKGFCQMK
jgi:hypothetical protein